MFAEIAPRALLSDAESKKQPELHYRPEPGLSERHEFIFMALQQMAAATKDVLSVEQMARIAYRTGYGTAMGHTIKNKEKLLARVRRVRGQVQAVERALEQEKGCAAVLQLVVAARGAMNSLMAEVIEDHIRLHVVDPARERQTGRAKGAEELIEVIQSYLR